MFRLWLEFWLLFWVYGVRVWDGVGWGLFLVNWRSVGKPKYAFSTLNSLGGNCLMWGVKVWAESGGSSVGGEPVPPPPSTSVEPTRKSRKKLYALLGVVLIAVLISVVVITFFVPRGLGETIPYGFNYAVGEKMVYDLSMSASMNGRSTSETGMISMEVLSFDGANYTINETASFTVQGMQQQEVSFTVKMNKFGQMTDFSGLPSQMQSIYSMFGGVPGFGLAFNKTEARVGESWQVPLNLGNSTFSMSGTINCKFGEVQNVTMAAGSFKTFKMEISTNDVHASASGVSVNINMHGWVLQEYGTCHAIDLSLEETASASGQGQSMTLTLSMQMTLRQYTHP